MILARRQEPVLVVAFQAHDATRQRPLEPKDGIDAPFRVRAAVDVVTQEHDGVVGLNQRHDLAQEIDERLEVPMDVTYRESGHDEDGEEVPVARCRA